MKKKLLSALLVGALSLSMVACGSGDKEENTEDSANQPAQTQSNDQEDSKEQSEDKKEDDKAEEDKEDKGSVVVYMPSPTDLNTAYVEGFEKKTGIKVELFEGTTGKILARLEAEKENPVADVVVLASRSDGLNMKNSDQVESFPEAENADKLYDGRVDEDKMLFGTSASAMGVIYNTSLVDKLDADRSELSDEKYKDMIAIPDPEKSGSCKDFLAGYMNSTDNDRDTREKMAANGLTVAGANKAALESVTTGEKAILVAGVDYNAYAKKEAGEPIDIYYPKSGTVINPRPAMILKTSKNKENAKAFINYLMSDEAQQMVADAYLLPGRKDITCENRDNVADIPTFKDLDWDEMMKNSSDIASKLNSLCQK